ncbi:leucine-rich repeat domain-containing protein [Pseudoprevotella muciniphila]|uniref:Leucine-rich repeat domain-containing protein n=1 Tax=Pseudoprevotella muciniphila TaxID=2133944 RepID=A0A5P8E849_9BACT|nr:leucine-rich repeat domain-containing protein [Pseudoprevotella muciniphila]QFQ13122.1 leucine-rich repeat domain-containing protein [Pseudoprevotella muciniphila]
MKRKLLFLLLPLILCGTNALAHDIEVDGIYYVYTNNKTKLGVSYRGTSYSSYSNEYSGKVVIPDSVTYNGTTYPVTSIENYAFYNCSGLSSVTIPSSVSTIGSSAFYKCSGLTKVNITDIASWCKISFGNDSANPLYYAEHLYLNDSEVTELVIPSSVTSIGSYAFCNCSSMTSLTIPNSVTSIGREAFSGCSGLTSVTIPNSVTSIGDYAFYNCSGLTSITIPNSVTSIGRGAFSGCSGLTSVTIPNSVTSIGDYAFYNCSGLTSITIPNSVTSIGREAFSGCSGLTSVTIPNSVTSIGDYAFYNCSGLTSITIPNSVTSIGRDVFPSATKIYAEKGKVSVLVLWRASYTVYDKDTQKSLPKPTLSYSSTQSTVKLTINNRDDSYKYKITSDTKVAEANVLNLSLYPDYYGWAYLYAAEKNAEDWYSLEEYKEYFTSSLNASVSTTATTASSLSVKGSYTQGDATVTAQKLQINGTTYDVSDGKAATFTGLNPNKEYTATYTVTANGHTYTKTGKFTTAALTLTTRQPKVVSAGNVIVAAASNISEEEENVGFEWRRTDWTGDFASNTGTAYVYTDGTAGTNMIEGYIRNLNTEKLWKYRPYYLANDGTYYYGDWVGLDPTNTSYFEPTVHTYAKVDIQGNTVLVKGYALRGSDNVTVKGFMYWKNTGKSAPKLMAVTIPANAKTLTVTGSSQIMTASLSDLDYDAEYSYVSFMTTSEGDTYYGEVQTFRTEPDVTGISEVMTADEPAAETARTGIYTLSGVKLSDDSSRLRTLPAGVYIVNGKKVVKK